MRHYHIPIFVPHKGCPFDCIFCNQRHIAGQQQDVTPWDVKETIQSYLASFQSTERFVEAAFFGGSFTGIPAAEQEALLQAAYQYKEAGLIDGIRLSTRPDYIDREVLARLARFGVTTVELGVQSLCPEVLEAAGRGHTVHDVEEAVALLREYPFSVGLQLMTGLPGDSTEKSLKTVQDAILMKPDFVRIYPTLVVADTALAELYRNGKYQPMDLESAVKLCKEMKVCFRAARIPVIRVSLQTTEEICPGGAVVAGPYHSAFGELVDGDIIFDALCVQTEGKWGGTVLVRAHPSDISRVVGHGKRNAKRFASQLGMSLKLVPDPAMRPFSQGGMPVLEQIQRE